MATFALLAKRGVLPDLRSESQKGRFHPFSFVSRFVNAPTLKRLTPSFFRAAGAPWRSLLSSSRTDQAPDSVLLEVWVTCRWFCSLSALPLFPL